MRPTLQDRTDQTPKAYPMMPISRRRLDLPLLLTGALLTIGCAAGEPISEFEEEFSTRPDTATLSPRSVAIGGSRQCRSRGLPGTRVGALLAA